MTHFKVLPTRGPAIDPRRNIAISQPRESICENRVSIVVPFK